MTGQSGCFGSTYQLPVDDIGEAAAAVDDIVSGMAADDAGQRAANQSAAPVAIMLFETARRVRLLSWAVALMAAYIVLKEL